MRYYFPEPAVLQPSLPPDDSAGSGLFFNRFPIMRASIFHLVLCGPMMWVGVGFAHSGPHHSGEKKSASVTPPAIPEAAPLGADAWVRLGNLLMQQSRNRVDHDFTAAGNAFGKAIAIDATHPEALIGMAWVKNSEHDFAAGDEWARKALAVDPELQDAYCLMADGAVERGDYKTALEHLKKALEIREDLASLSRTAHLMWLTGQSGKARLMMGRAIAAGGPFPENIAWCRAELAVMHLHDGALLPAAQQVELALAAAPRNPRVLAAHGRLLAAKMEWGSAIEAYRNSATITPTHDSLASLSDLYRAQGDLAAAEAQDLRVVEFHGAAAHSHGGEVHSHGPGNAQLALFLADHGKDLDVALEEAEAAVEAFPNIAALDTLAWCQFKKGDLKAARDTIRKAMQWRTPDPSIHFHAGMIHAGLGENEEAKRHLGRALQLNPRFHPLHAAQAVEVLSALAPRGDVAASATK